MEKTSPADGAELAIRFSFQPNALCYCGPNTANAAFISYLQNKQDLQAVQQAIERFEGLYPYLSFLAKKSGKELLDPAVVEGYWLGNDLACSVTKEELASIIDALASRGLMRSLADKLIAQLPLGLSATHAFHVLFVGPGNTAHTVKPTLSVKDQCIISWGRVLSVGQNLTVARRPLLFEHGRYVLGEEETRTVHYLPEFLSVKKDDIIAIHWGFACMVLSLQQQQRLEKNLLQTMSVLNKHCANYAFVDDVSSTA